MLAVVTYVDHRVSTGPHSKKFSLDHFEKKANTKLRKRNEEWRDAVYIDDAPINGPNLYIILMGFHDPDLPGQLKSIGVPICCMLQIKRPDEELNQNIEEEIDIDESKKLVFFEKYTVSKWRNDCRKPNCIPNITTLDSSCSVHRDIRKL